MRHHDVQDHSGYRQPDLLPRPPVPQHLHAYTPPPPGYITGTPVPSSLSAYQQQGTFVHPPTSHQAATYACTPPRDQRPVSGEAYRGPFDSPDAFYRSRGQGQQAYANVPPDFHQQLRDAYEAGRAREAQGARSGGRYPTDLGHGTSFQSRSVPSLLHTPPLCTHVRM